MRAITGRTSRPAARLPPRNGYRGAVARKSRNRGGAPTARPTQAVNAAPSGAAQTGTAQLTAPAADADSATSQNKQNKQNNSQNKQNKQNKETHPYPGQQLGLPERGPGSVSSMPRRVLALFIDWLLSMVIAYWLTHSQFWTIAVFAVEVYVLTALGGSTVGKRLVGIRTVRVGGGPVGFGWALVRTAILLTVVPPLLTDRDLRGLHDRAANTVVVRI
jgi:RDD family protein